MDEQEIEARVMATPENENGWPARCLNCGDTPEHPRCIVCERCNRENTKGGRCPFVLYMALKTAWDLRRKAKPVAVPAPQEQAPRADGWPLLCLGGCGTVNPPCEDGEGRFACKTCAARDSASINEAWYAWKDKHTPVFPGEQPTSHPKPAAKAHTCLGVGVLNCSAEIPTTRKLCVDCEDRLIPDEPGPTTGSRLVGTAANTLGDMYREHPVIGMRERR